MRFHVGTSEILGEVVILEHKTLAPGESGLCQLRLREPVVAAAGADGAAGAVTVMMLRPIMITQRTNPQRIRLLKKKTSPSGGEAARKLTRMLKTKP